jgi:beta-barrel assembly-enhancing protease
MASTAQVAAVRALADQDIRIATIADRLARGGFGAADKGLCPGHTSLPGLIIQDITQYAASDRDAARAALMLSDGPTIVAILPPTMRATGTLRAGDRIVSVDGTPIAKAIPGDRYARVQQAEDLIETALARQTAMVTVQRGVQTVQAVIEAQPGCASRVQIVPGRALNSQADGRYVQITSAMIDFAGDDDAIATVIAHEMAHNILRHQARHTPSQRAEYQADRLGAWLVARGGYRLDAVVPFWTRLGRRTGAGIFSDGTHPRWKPRIAQLRVAVGMITAQRTAGAALEPGVVN